jgi:CRP-like cAMP-binding protein
LFCSQSEDGNVAFSAGLDAGAMSIDRGCAAPANGVWRIAEGWACQQRVGNDGRRHILALLLPGDVLPEHSRHYDVVALTKLKLDRVEDGAGAEAGMERDAALGRLFSHAVRLANQDAYGRIAELLIELHERLSRAGLTKGCRFTCPIGQERIGEMMGLSEVHVNRTLAKLKVDGHLLTGPGWYALPDPDRLRRALNAASTH